LPRLRGEGNYKINYRHIIDSLVKKPEAFENFRYRDAMFPTSRFRIAYDNLKKRYAFKSAAKRYLNILFLAAKGSEIAVDSALMVLINENQEITQEAVEHLLESNTSVFRPDDVHIQAINLSCYDCEKANFIIANPTFTEELKNFSRDKIQMIGTRCTSLH
jgi:hypothetical protein